MSRGSQKEVEDITEHGVAGYIQLWSDENDIEAHSRSS